MTNVIFRAKRIDDGSWVFWNLFGELTNESGRIKSQKHKTKNGVYVCHYIQQLKHFIDKNTVSMSSGLEDIAGCQIFAGDILLWEDSEGGKHYCEAAYKDGCFVIHPESDVMETLIESLALLMEIAGNVIDTPELLEVRDA